MTVTTEGIAPIRLVRFTGAMYLLQMATGVFTQIHARGSLIVRDNATQTARNILDSEQLFRIGIASDLVTYIAVLLATWGLYVLLRPIDRNLAVLAVFFAWIGALCVPALQVPVHTATHRRLGRVRLAAAGRVCAVHHRVPESRLAAAPAHAPDGRLRGHSWILAAVAG